MKFRTEIHPAFPEHVKIKPKDVLLLSGSCFSTEIGKKFYESGWKTYINPCGIFFHPMSMGQVILQIFHDKSFQNSHCIKRDDQYFSLYYHSDIHGNTEQELLDKIETCNKNLRKDIEEADKIFFTWGTSYYFFHKANGILAANCHKLPDKEFERRLSDPEEIIAMYRKIFFQIREINSRALIFITVSPVRYIRHGVVENALSKAILLYAAHCLVREELCYYFPSYELVTEDLKDYRFYKSDLMHPSEVATQYVWEKLTDSLLTEDSRKMAEKISGLYSMLRHEFRGTAEKRSQWDDAIRKNYWMCVKDYPALSEREEWKLYKTNADE